MEQINLNVIPDGVMPVCHASQFDKNRTIRFNLKDNGSVYTLAGTETITCKVRKPDDTENTINVANTSSSYVDVTFGLGDTDLSGYSMCELKIVKGTQTIGSRNFLLNVEADAYDGSVFEERSASGEIASFETNFIDNLTECIVDIDAVQDLHGYDKPWSGGAGKNKFDSDIVLSNFTKNNNKYVGKPGSVIGKYVISGGFKTNTQYTLSYKAYNNTSTPSNFRFVVSYTDETEEIIGGFVDTTTEKVIVGTSAKNKTISYITRNYGNSVEFTLYDIQLEEGSTATTYAPYSNICPITGHDSGVITVTDNDQITNTYTVDFGQTVYGGSLNVTTGELTVTSGYIASYNGEAINEPWISSIDEYVPNTSPSTGAEVVYTLATPTTVQLTPTEVRTLLEDNNIFADTGDVVSCKYLVEVT